MTDSFQLERTEIYSGDTDLPLFYFRYSDSSADPASMACVGLQGKKKSMSCLNAIIGRIRRSAFRSKYFGDSLLSLRTIII